MYSLFKYGTLHDSAFGLYEDTLSTPEALLHATTSSFLSLYITDRLSRDFGSTPTPLSKLLAFAAGGVGASYLGSCLTDSLTKIPEPPKEIEDQEASSDFSRTTTS